MRPGELLTEINVKPTYTAPYSLRCVLSNVLNMICETDTRPYNTATSWSDTGPAGLGTADALTDWWKLLSEAARNPEGLTDLYEQLSTQVQPLWLSLFANERRRPNFGRDLRSRLTRAIEAGGPATEDGKTASSRRRILMESAGTFMTYNYPAPREMFMFEKILDTERFPLMWLPSPHGEVSASIALLSWQLHSWKLRRSHFKQEDAYETVKSNAKPSGALLGALDIKRKWVGLWVLLSLQWVRFHQEANPLRTELKTEVAKRFERLGPLVERDLEDEKWLRENVPLEPVLGFIARSVSQVTGTGLLGDGRVVLIPTYAEMPKDSIVDKATGSGNTRLTFPDVVSMWNNAAMEYRDAPWTPGATAASVGSFPGNAGATVSASALRRLLESMTGMVDLIRNAATMLGWTNPAGSALRLNYVGADFNLTDGTGFSNDPVASVLGLVPVLPLASGRHVRLTERMESQFNVAPEGRGSQAGDSANAVVRIGVYDVPVDCPVPEADLPETLRRTYLPSPCVMGEQLVDRIYAAENEQEPVMTRLTQAWAQQPIVPWNSFSRRHARPTSGEGVQLLRFTNWDTYAATAGATDGMQLLTRGWRSLTSAQPSERFESYARRPNDQPFAVRVLIMDARTDNRAYQAYTSDWTRVETGDPLTELGLVIYDGDVNLKYGQGALASLSSLIHSQGG